MLLEHFLEFESVLEFSDTRMELQMGELSVGIVRCKRVVGKGPAGMEYIPVMVAEHEIPQMVSTYQMGIRDYDVEKAFEAMKKCRLLQLHMLQVVLPVIAIWCLI